MPSTNKTYMRLRIMNTSNYMNTKVADSIFEFELFRLDSILNSMFEFFSFFETEEFDEAKMQESLKKVVLALNPALSNETAEQSASYPALSLALSNASNITAALIAAWKSQSKVSTKDMEALLNDAENNQQGGEDQIIENLSEILKGSLAYICDGGTVIKEPTSSVAVGARILACVVNKLEDKK